MESRYSAETITVHNNFQPSDPLCWAYALAAGVEESVLMFDHNKRLVHYNNKFGTLDDADDHELYNLKTVARYLNRYYRGVEWQAMEIDKVFKTRVPYRFKLKKFSGEEYESIAYPVIMEGSRLGGVVVTVSRNGSTL